MHKLTLKQRRRHRELVAEFDRLKGNPYLQLPENYEFDVDKEEDEKYKEVIQAFNAIVKEMHELEEIGRTGD